MMKKTTTMILFFLGSLFIICAGGNTEQTKGEDVQLNEQGSVKIDDFSIRFELDDNNLIIEVSAPTTGWVAIGFNPTFRMKDANIIIGYIANGNAFGQDEFGNSAISHKPDTSVGGTNDVSNISGTEKDGITTISFSMPLQTDDDYDQVLEKGKEYKIILAYGRAGKDDFTSLHAKRISAKIVIPN